MSDCLNVEMREMLPELVHGTLSADDALAELRRLPFADLGFARVDHHRTLRQGRAEAVYGPPRDALMAADLSDVAPEFGFDPSRSPFDSERR